MSFAGWRKTSNLKRAFKWTILLTVLVVFWSYLNLPVSESPNLQTVKRFAPQKLPDYECPNRKATQEHRRRYKTYGYNFSADVQTLVLADSPTSRNVRFLSQFLQSARLRFKVESIGKRFPLLTFLGQARFDIIIIDNYYKYINLAANSRKILDEYCQAYNVSIVAFLSSTNSNFTRLSVKGFPLRFRQRQRVHSLRFSESSDIPWIAKTGTILPSPTPNLNEWILFEKDKFHDVVLNAKDSMNIERAIVVRDVGRFDGIERIIFGHNITQWMVRMALLDTMCYLLAGRHQLAVCDPLRYVQVDIDDVFVGHSGVRLLREDVEALVKTQDVLRTFVKDFTFSLGFSGFYFRNGDAEEDKGDELLIEWASKFRWFPHMWRHNHVHEHNYTFLEAIMTQNKLFAQSMKLPLLDGYAVSPQHTGVYPVYPDLYKAWRKVWNVTVTSTEQYPHFFHSSQRKGFTYDGISVLPRQTCGLYTHTYFFHSYPGGLSALTRNVFGGDLFNAILFNQYSIFMTHQQNFANDRLGSYVFKNALAFLKCWTNIRTEWIDPVSSSDLYFKQHSAEKKLIWTNPCTDSKHQKILPPFYNCTRMLFPNIVITGPQKTGTTALSIFLSLHPNVSTNIEIDGSFEEMQFFGGGRNYNNGPVWYSEKFEKNRSPSTTFVFEKTANYFDNSFAPASTHSLLPDARIVVLLMDPALRAHSWYQHLRAHNDSVAGTMNLDEILDATVGSDAFRVRQRLLTAGRYAYHLLRWLDFYTPEQLVLLDADRLRLDPGGVMNDFIAVLGLPPLDYSKVLRFDQAKRFFCIFEQGKSKRCLGKGKGRSYPPLDDRTRTKLNRLYSEDNSELHQLLAYLQVQPPAWLRNLRVNY